MAAPFPVAGPPPGYSGHQHPHPAVIGAAYEPQQGAAYPAQPLVQPHGAPSAPAAPQGYAQAPPQVYGQVRSSLLLPLVSLAHTSAFGSGAGDTASASARLHGTS